MPVDGAKVIEETARGNMGLPDRNSTERVVPGSGINNVRPGDVAAEKPASKL
jgi:hypothetical protein